jgi:hypothetical protein
MNEDRWIERMREDAARLRFQPDDVMTSRLAARVRERIAARPATVSGVLLGWFRPLAASLAALSLVAMLGITWLARSSEPAVEELAANSSIEISLDGDVYSVGD